MGIGQELEMIRKLRGLSVIDICNAMDLTEMQYHYIVLYNRRPTVYQLIMFISTTRHPLDSIM